MKSISVGAIIFSVAVVVIYIVFAYVDLVYFTPLGWQELSPGELSAETRRALFLSMGCVVGIMSKLLFDALTTASEQRVETETPTSFFDTIRAFIRSVMISLIVSPIVILSFYGSIDGIESDVVAVLLAYQNGFFFQTVLSKPNRAIRG